MKERTSDDRPFELGLSGVMMLQIGQTDQLKLFFLTHILELPLIFYHDFTFQCAGRFK